MYSVTTDGGTSIIGNRVGFSTFYKMHEESPNDAMLTFLTPKWPTLETAVQDYNLYVH